MFRSAALATPLSVDSSLGSLRPVLGHAELFEPVRNLLHCGAASGGIHLEQTELLTARARKETTKYVTERDPH